MIRKSSEAKTFTSRLTVEECFERLHAVTKPTTLFYSANEAELPLEGTVDPRTFRVFRWTQYRNSFLTEVRGEWRALAGGETEIVLTTVPAQVGLFIAFWCTFLGGLGLLALFAGIAGGNVNVMPFGALSLVLVVFGVLLAKHEGARGERDALYVVSLITETLEIAPLDDRAARAEARRERALKWRVRAESVAVDHDDEDDEEEDEEVDEGEPGSSGRHTKR